MNRRVGSEMLKLVRSWSAISYVRRNFQRSVTRSCSRQDTAGGGDPEATSLTVRQDSALQDSPPPAGFVSFTKRRESALADMEEFDKLPKFEDPVKRTGRAFKRDFNIIGRGVRKAVGVGFDPNEAVVPPIFPAHTDIVIIGGGAIGCSIAYWLKQRVPGGFRLTVVERDNTYSEASTSLSVGGLRQQFSLQESIEMSLFGADFIRTIDRSLALEGHTPPNAYFEPHGYLFLSREETAPILQANSDLQRRLGAKNMLLDPAGLKERFPWLNTENLALGCLGLEKEGWFDPWSLLNALKRKSINLGAEYINGEVVGFEFRDQHLIVAPTKDGTYEQLERVVLRMPDGELKAIKFGICIIAAGAYSGEIGRMARMGEGEGILAVPLPIEPRKRYTYCFHCPDGPGLNAPLTVDVTGAYFRREGLGGCYIGGLSPSPFEEPSPDNLDVDYEFFEERLWPVLAHRIPAFERLKLRSGWAGFYEYNVLDQNGVVGPHPLYHNLMIASGFSGHGIQHAPAIGRAVMELILDGEYKTIDLSRFGFERLCMNEPLYEHGIV